MKFSIIKAMAKMMNFNVVNAAPATTKFACRKGSSDLLCPCQACRPAFLRLQAD